MTASRHGAEETREWFFNLLLSRPCTRREAQDRLQRRRVPDETAADLLDEAEGTGLVDDAAYARLFAEGHGTWGRERVAFELGRRGVSREDINAALNDMNEEERARELVSSWRKSGLDERRIMSRLRSRGFSSRAVHFACRGEDEIPW